MLRWSRRRRRWSNPAAPGNAQYSSIGASASNSSSALRTSLSVAASSAVWIDSDSAASRNALQRSARSCVALK